MDKTIIMPYVKFSTYMNILKKEYNHREKMLSMEMHHILDKMDSFYLLLDMMADVFDDKDGVLCEWVFEYNFGEDSNLTVRELYDKLIQKGSNNGEQKNV